MTLKNNKDENEAQEENNSHDDLFQDRIDELLLIEQRAEGRAERFFELNKKYQEKWEEKNQLAQNELVTKITAVEESLKNISHASDTVSRYVNSCINQTTRTTQVFLGAVVIALIIVAGTLGWARYINSTLEGAKTELASLNTKLKHTPVILHFKGKDYVRIIPNSETSFSRDNGDEVPGRYAKVWHVR